MSPLVAEIYGPDEAGRQQLAGRVAQAFGQTADIVGVDTSLKEDAPRAWLRVRRQRAESSRSPRYEPRARPPSALSSKETRGPASAAASSAAASASRLPVDDEPRPVRPRRRDSVRTS